MRVRHAVAGLAYSVICVGGFLIFAVVMALLFGLLHAIGGGIVDGLRMDPKGFLGGLIQAGIPGMASVSLAVTIVLKGLDPLFDRLERWKVQ